MGCGGVAAGGEAECMAEDELKVDARVGEGDNSGGREAESMGRDAEEYNGAWSLV